jgi:cysteine desulfurase
MGKTEAGRRMPKEWRNPKSELREAVLLSFARSGFLSCPSFVNRHSSMLYFDHNATHPLSAAARAAWLDATDRYVGNPSSPHRLGARADAALTSAREKLAAWLGCSPTQIVWTSGATEANNAILHHAALTGQGEAWVSAIEHPRVIEATRAHFAERARNIPVSTDGIVDLDWLTKALEHGRPALVGVMAANNETGVLQPWREALALCREHEVPFFCDAAQWIGKLATDGLGECDFVSGCGHKFGGPQGVGFLKVPPKFRPFIVGGPQEGGRRAGTENVAGILAMIAALEERIAAITPQTIAERVAVRAEFEASLLRVLPGVEIVGAGTDRLWNTVAAVMPEISDCRQRWVVKLDKLGFAVSTGSACSSGKEDPSHVLAAMKIETDKASRALRFSSGWETRAGDWQELLAGIEQAYREMAP